MKKYPHAITKICGNCERVFTCKGTGWTRRKDTGKCPHECNVCWCEKCNYGTSRPEGCEEVDLKEVVQFT